jgi:hypothetical protein
MASHIEIDSRGLKKLRDTLHEESSGDRFVEAVAANCAGLELVSPGICSSCDECQSAFGMDEEELAAAYSNGEVCDEGSFSKSSCDCCGSSLGGDRYAAHGIDKVGVPNAQIIHFDICSDCLFYIANGDVPERWDG